MFDQPASVYGRLFVSFVCLNRQKDRKTGIDLGSFARVRPNGVGDLVSQIQLFGMLVSQFHSKRWTTSIEGKPILCYFYPETRPADPFGIRTRDGPMDFLFRKSFSLSFKSSVVLVFIFEEDHRESNVSSKPYVSEK